MDCYKIDSYQGMLMFRLSDFFLIGGMSQTGPFALSLPKGCVQGAPWLRQAQTERLRKMCLRHVPDQGLFS